MNSFRAQRRLNFWLLVGILAEGWVLVVSLSGALDAWIELNRQNDILAGFDARHALASKAGARQAGAPSDLAERSPSPPSDGSRRNTEEAEFAAVSRQMAVDPRAGAIHYARNRLRVQRQYGSLFAELGLPPEKLGALKDILVQQLQDRELKSFRVILVEPSVQQATELVSDGRIEALLTPEEMKTYRTYRDTAVLRGELENLEYEMADRGLAISGDQVKAVIRLCLTSGTSGGLADYFHSGRENLEELMRGTSPSLSLEQVAAIGEFLSERELAARRRTELASKLK